MILKDYIKYFEVLIYNSVFFNSQGGVVFRIATIDEAYSDFISNVGGNGLFFRLFVPSVDVKDNLDNQYADTNVGFEVGMLCKSNDNDSRVVSLTDAEYYAKKILDRIHYDSMFEVQSLVAGSFNKVQFKMRYNLTSGDGSYASVIVLFSINPIVSFCSINESDWLDK
jgi:hypothetical protein